MQKIKIAISSFGNIGQAILQTHLDHVAKFGSKNDISLVGIIRRNVTGKSNGVPVVSDVRALKVKPDVILCAGPSGCVKEDVKKFLSLGISTVDCFDSHPKIVKYREDLGKLAVKNHAVSILATGWDPGFDSIQRALFMQLSPLGETLTTFGPGRSMGHTTEVKAIEGVKDAVSLTLPGSKPGTQRREVYVVADKSQHQRLEKEIKNHPYFVKDLTVVKFVSSIAKHDTNKHKGHLINSGKDVKVDITLSGVNPVMTANVMYAAARAVFRARAEKRFGCFTVVELAPLDFIQGATVKERLQRIKY
ncbi:MAG: diaminopimelate dehydrogenase [Fibromonadales bacterium]|nr:diaminopimelate dehydrogenase [Fibromonadales bacterium]MCL2261563.1 diaminopimelate dehydrogenase [Fibromonadales bacterium]